jgi:hypothetical protein
MAVLESGRSGGAGFCEIRATWLTTLTSFRKVCSAKGNKFGQNQAWNGGITASS